MGWFSCFFVTHAHICPTRSNRTSEPCKDFSFIETMVTYPFAIGLHQASQFCTGPMPMVSMRRPMIRYWHRLPVISMFMLLMRAVTGFQHLPLIRRTILAGTDIETILFLCSNICATKLVVKSGLVGIRWAGERR